MILLCLSFLIRLNELKMNSHDLNYRFSISEKSNFLQDFKMVQSKRMPKAFGFATLGYGNPPGSDFFKMSLIHIILWVQE